MTFANKRSALLLQSHITILDVVGLDGLATVVGCIDVLNSEVKERSRVARVFEECTYCRVASGTHILHGSKYAHRRLRGGYAHKNERVTRDVESE